MNDQQLIALIISSLTTALTEYGFTDPNIVQSFQADHQGENLEPTWYIHRLSNHKYGNTGTKQVLNNVTNLFDVTETRILERKFQITTLRKQDSANWDDNDAFDMAEVGAAAIESETFTSLLRAEGASIYKITDVRAPYFQDASDENQLSPNFDFTVIYNREYSRTAQKVDTVSDNITRLPEG